MKPVVAITVGDYNGIGPEVALKAVLKPSVGDACIPLLVGPEEALVGTARMLHKRVTFRSAHTGGIARDVSQRSPWFFDEGLPGVSRWTPGKATAHAGKVAGVALSTAVRLALQGRVHAVVTGPVSKKGLHLAGYPFPGQTEFVQQLTGSAHVAMILASRTMRVGLATIHVPLRKVAGLLTRRLLTERIRVIHRALQTDWKIRRPHMAVLGLNPHAGEHGDIGSEDGSVIAPVVRNFRRQGMHIDGPFPADAFFGRYASGHYDAIVAMYHDQGLIPLKMSSFGAAVNISAGLPIVRTSPDHGTAYDIAGKGIADPGSMVEAILLAVRITRNRMLTTKRKR